MSATSGLARGYRPEPTEADASSPKRNAGQNEHQAADDQTGDRLPEQEGAVDDREGGNEVGDQDRARGAGARDQGVVEDVGEAGPRDPEREDGGRHLPAGDV